MSFPFMLEGAVPWIFCVSVSGDSRCPSKTLGFPMPVEGGLSGDGDGFIRMGRRGHKHSVLVSSAPIYVFLGHC